MTDRQTGDTTGARGATLRRLVPLALLLALAALAVWLDLHRLVTLDQLAHNREALRGLVAGSPPLALAAFMAVYTAVVALSLPGGAALTLAGGFLFGWLAAGLASVLAATAGATLLFLIARSALGEPLAARAGPRLARLRRGFQEDAMSYLLFLRLVPAFPFWLVNLAPALLGVRLSTFVAGTFLGIIPGTFAFAFIGAGLDGAIAAQIAANPDCARAGEGCVLRLDPAALVTREMLIGLAALGVVALLPAVLRRRRARRFPPCRPDRTDASP